MPAENISVSIRYRHSVALIHPINSIIPTRLDKIVLGQTLKSDWQLLIFNGFSTDRKISSRARKKNFEQTCSSFSFSFSFCHVVLFSQPAASTGVCFLITEAKFRRRDRSVFQWLAKLFRASKTSVLQPRPNRTAISPETSWKLAPREGSARASAFGKALVQTSGEFQRRRNWSWSVSCSASRPSFSETYRLLICENNTRNNYRACGAMILLPVKWNVPELHWLAKLSARFLAWFWSSAISRKWETWRTLGCLRPWKGWFTSLTIES